MVVESKRQQAREAVPVGHQSITDGGLHPRGALIVVVVVAVLAIISFTR
jgi:hypothetical protein